jgi:hypothetical protein
MDIPAANIVVRRVESSSSFGSSRVLNPVYSRAPADDETA